VTCAVKHEMFKQIATGIPRHLDLDAIEQLLLYTPAGLSRREAQVCARVITGMTIDRTAADLAIKRTSVVTYRQRAYEKLNISRQNELVALVNNLRVNMTSLPALS
jgi:DNA-binding CsgD family transcriptional regulator